MWFLLTGSSHVVVYLVTQFVSDIKQSPEMYLFLQGYLPTNLDRRKPTLERKRQEYYSFIDQYFDTRHQDLHKETFRQVINGGFEW